MSYSSVSKPGDHTQHKANQESCEKSNKIGKEEKNICTYYLNFLL